MRRGIVVNRKVDEDDIVFVAVCPVFAKFDHCFVGVLNKVSISKDHTLIIMFYEDRL